MLGYLIEAQLHGLGVGKGKSERRADAARRTNGRERIGVFIALIGWLAGPRSASRPLPNEAVFPANATLVLEPDFDCRIARQIREMGVQNARKVFYMPRRSRHPGRDGEGAR
jgi:hypothetical protein